MTDTRNFGSTTPKVGAGWGWMLGSGVLSVVLGLAAFIWPFAATYAATLVIGMFFLIAGGVSIAAGLAGRSHERRGYAFGFGILSLVVGLVMVFAPAAAALSLTLMVAVWLGLRGAMEIWFGTRLSRGRGLMIGLGVLNVVLAIVVLATLPFSALTLPGYILGISFLFSGFTSVVAALDHRKGAAAFGSPS